MKLGPFELDRGGIGERRNGFGILSLGAIATVATIVLAANAPSLRPAPEHVPVTFPVEAAGMPAPAE